MKEGTLEQRFKQRGENNKEYDESDTESQLKLRTI